MRLIPAACAACALAAAVLCAPAAGHAFLDDLFGSGVDPELVAQVPPEKRGPIKQADYALACANQDLDLANLKEQLASRQADLASLGAKLAKTQAKGAQINLNIAKMTAVVDANLGNREDTTTVLNDLLAARVSNQEDIDSVKGQMDRTRDRIADLTKQVADKTKTVAEFKGIGTPKPAAAPAKPAATSAPAEAPVDSSAVVIEHKEPGAAPDATDQVAPGQTLTN